MAKSFAVIICAAGASSRFGGKKSKPFVNVAGRAAFLYSIELFSNRNDVKQILLAISPKDEEMVTVQWASNLKFFGVKIFHGGTERFETVKKGLELVKEDINLIAVHDAVRCCVTEEWVDKCFAAAAKGGAAILACPVVATLKKAKDNTIIETIDRTAFFEAQTPQVFEAKLLRKAYSNLENLNANNISDDSQLVEALGHPVTIVETDSSNLKLTHPGDVAVAEAIIKSRSRRGPKGYIGPYAEGQW